MCLKERETVTEAGIKTDTKTERQTKRDIHVRLLCNILWIGNDLAIWEQSHEKDRQTERHRIRARQADRQKEIRQRNRKARYKTRNYNL